MNSLNVSIQDTLVGKLFVEKDEYYFEYDRSWKQNGFAISPHIGFKNSASSKTIKRFLDNLIPEGEHLDDIVSFAHISKNNTFGILNIIGYDTAGALFFGDKKLDTPYFREITQKELISRIEEIESKSIAIWDKKVRLSLAGVQAKLPIMINQNKLGLADGTLSSTHIMKFQTKKNSHIVLNEYLCMKLAKDIGLNVADVELRRFQNHPTLLIKRFDRILKDNYVQRLHTIDGCQMLDLPPSYKYEQNFGNQRDVAHIRDGVSFKKLFLSSKECLVPATAKMELLNWAVFNLLIGNSDAHGKNFSFFINKNGIKPTLFYDLLSVMIYDVDHQTSMAYGDEFDPNQIFAYQLREFAEDIDINYKLVKKTILKQTSKILQVLENQTFDIVINKDEKEFLFSLISLISKRAKDFQEIANEMELVSYP